MNGKKGLSRIMSALLAASSMIGGASAGKKKVGKRPDSAGVVLRDRENRGRDKGGNERGNKRGEELGLSSAESRVVSWIKKHPKTSAGLGLAGLGAIGCGVYKGYKFWYNSGSYKIVDNNSGSYKIVDNNSGSYKIVDNNSEWDTYYRGVFSEETFASYYERDQIRLEFADGKVFYHHYGEVGGVGIIFSCDVNNTGHRSLLSAIAMSKFLMNCYTKVCDCLGSSIELESTCPMGTFYGFDDIEKKFCEKFPNYSQKISKVVKFYSDFTGRYLGKLVDELVKYGEKIKAELEVFGNKVVCLFIESLG